MARPGQEEEELQYAIAYDVHVLSLYGAGMDTVSMLDQGIAGSLQGSILAALVILACLYRWMQFS